MIHINRFLVYESLDTAIKKFFKDKINWKLVNYVDYLFQELEDLDYDTNLIIATKNENNRGTYDHQTIWSSYKNRFFDNKLNKNIETLMQNYEKNGLYFIIRLQQNEDSGLDFNIINSLYEKIKLKFDIKPDNVEDDDRIRYYTMPK